MLYFTASSSAFDYGLWRSDGTNIGTVSVKSFPSLSLYGPIVFYNGHFIFTANDNNNDSRFWASDGTTQGTYPFSSVNTALRLYNGAIGSPIGVYNGDLYLDANFDSTGYELWLYHNDSLGVNSIQALGVDKIVTAFPNPFDNYITINGLSDQSDCAIEIVDMMGRQCLNTRLQPSSGKISLPVSALASGLFIIHVASSTDNISFKMIKN